MPCLFSKCKQEPCILFWKLEIHLKSQLYCCNWTGSWRHLTHIISERGGKALKAGTWFIFHHTSLSIPKVGRTTRVPMATLSYFSHTALSCQLTVPKKWKIFSLTWLCFSPRRKTAECCLLHMVARISTKLSMSCPSVYEARHPFLVSKPSTMDGLME